ncbi:hypothetical protein [Methyloglobulus sp.]|uniref:hypothetical protein n=1 Tax=Methyloglobulus sp. TaxID=2518622 RepID=UPI0032B83B38
MPELTNQQQSAKFCHSRFLAVMRFKVHLPPSQILRPNMMALLARSVIKRG